jgi:hypothetical protein
VVKKKMIKLDLNDFVWHQLDSLFSFLLSYLGGGALFNPGTPVYPTNTISAKVIS